MRGLNSRFPPTSSFLAYADGSMNESWTGIGYCCEGLDIIWNSHTGHYPSSSPTCIQLEVYAISELRASDSLLKKIGEKIFVCSDNESAIKAIQSPVVTSGVQEKPKRTGKE